MFSPEVDDAFAELKQTALTIKAERDRYEAALTKIAAWQPYQPFGGPVNDYERGANDMLETLQQIAKEALTP